MKEGGLGDQAADAPAVNHLLAIGQALAEIQAQQNVMQQTLVGIQAQLQQQQTALVALAAHRPVQGN